MGYCDRLDQVFWGRIVEGGLENWAGKVIGCSNLGELFCGSLGEMQMMVV